MGRTTLHIEIRILLLSCFLLLLLSCSTQKIVSQKKPKDLAPNCIFVSDDLMCDVSEISNSGYALYIRWMEKKYGFDSEEYKSVLPDTTVWRYYFGDKKKLTDQYFFSDYYRDFPMVGVDREQAIEYATWRTDRVLEVQLLKKELIELQIIDGKVDDSFTAEKYFSGNYFDYKPDPSLNYYLKFSLPTDRERDTILQYAKHKKYNEKSIISIETQIKMDSLYHCPLGAVKSDLSKAKTNKLFHVLGNVAEWGAERGVAYGGSWLDSLDHILIEDKRKDAGRNSWTGFRNVCRWVSADTY